MRTATLTCCDQDGSTLKLPTSTPSEKKLPAILLFGMPGVGKGTQGTLLGTIRGVRHVSTGAIFRSLARDSEDGREVFSRIDHGELVPDEMAVRIWRHWVDEQVTECRFNLQREVLLLDGLPRSRRQCEILEEHIDPLCIIHLECERIDSLVERLMQRSEGRADDGDEAIIRRRFDIYRETTHPVLAYYPKSKVFSIDPIGSVMQVKKRILEVVVPILNARGFLISEDESAA